MAIDALDLAASIQPDVVVLVTGDSDFAYLAQKLRRRGIRAPVDARLSRQDAAAGASQALTVAEYLRDNDIVHAAMSAERNRIFMTRQGQLVVPVQYGKEIATGTLQSILKKAGLK